MPAPVKADLGAFYELLQVEIVAYSKRGAVL